MKKRIKNNKSFFIFHLKDEITNTTRKKFNYLKDDKFLKNKKWNFRKRSFAKGEISNLKILWSKDNSFFQSKKNNKYVGGIKRKFYPMTLVIKKSIEKIIINFINRDLISKKNVYLGAHAIRIVCNKNNLGYPVPEGFHHDGFDNVAIISVNKSSVSGGKSFLKNAKKKRIELSKTLRINEVLFFDDKKFMHYASPIKLTKNKLGFRDIIVLTFHKKVYR